MTSEPRRLFDVPTAELGESVVIMRTTNRPAARQIEAALRDRHEHALIEIVERLSATWIVASAMPSSADELWADARRVAPPGTRLERRLESGGGWVSAQIPMASEW